METNRIGLKIKERRIAIGMTQEELQEKLGYKNRSTISRIERGIADIPQVKVERFAKALNTSVEYLMGIEQDGVYYQNTETIKLSDSEKQQENELLSHYRKLNANGKKEANARIGEMTSISRWTDGEEGA